MRKHKRNKMLIASIVLIIYVILKVYVLNTPELKDDPIPDIILNLLLKQG